MRVFLRDSQWKKSRKVLMGFIKEVSLGDVSACGRSGCPLVPDRFEGGGNWVVGRWYRVWDDCSNVNANAK